MHYQYISLRKKLLYSEFFWSVSSRIWTKYGEILCVSPYSVRMRKNTDQNNSEYGHFSRSEMYWSVFSRIQTDYGEIRNTSQYSVRMRENTDQNNSEYSNFLRSVYVICLRI